MYIYVYSYKHIKYIIHTLLILRFALTGCSEPASCCALAQARGVDSSYLLAVRP